MAATSSAIFKYDVIIPIIVLVVCVHIPMTSSVCDLTSGCYPEVIDIMKNQDSFPDRSISVSSTCGETQAEKYLTFLSSDFTQYDCDSSAVSSSNLADGVSTTFWQSSVGTEPVTVVVNFTDAFLLYELIINFAVPKLTDAANSADARPLAWSLEKLAVDGETWVPLRHFAHDCAKSYPGVAVLDPFDEDYNVVYCQQYAEVDPTLAFLDSDNEVFYYPGISDVYSPFAYKNDPQVTAYFSTTAVRLYFKDLNRGVIQQTYVTISELVLDVRCQCNGHADICNGANGATCQCQHFTSGQQCESCLPLYNNQSWTFGNTNDAGACQECSCNQHSESCVFDQTKEYGVCQACKDNTAGDICNTCAAGYYINATWASADDVTKGGDYCLACDCNEAGTAPGQMNVCDVNSGQCTCKANVEGRDCSECKDTFYGLESGNADGCQACVCNSDGTVGDDSMCNKTDGACLCRANVQGVSCDACKPNTYGFDPSNTDGCLDCGCDPGGSSDQSCLVTTGKCNCRLNIGSRDCTVPNGGFFVPKLDLIVLEPEMTSTEGLVLRAGHGTSGSTVTGRGLVSVTSANPMVLEVTASYGGLMEMAVRYEKTTTNNNLIFLEATVSLTSTQSYSCGDVTVESGKVWALTKTEINTETSGTLQLGQVCLGKGATYSLELSNSGSAVLVDSIVFLPDVATLKTGVEGLLGAAAIDACFQNALDNVASNRGDCQGTEFSLMAAYLNGAQTCACTGGSVTSSSCSPYTGDCNCNTGVLPPKCDVCQPQAYQFNTQTGCIACQCHVNGSVNTFCDNQGVCECRPNVEGNKCDTCKADHYGLYTGEGCVPCQCDATYSQGSSCDDSGQCVCKPGVGGTNCDRCAHGNYNLTPEGCTSCGCDPQGSTGVGCDEVSGLCQCLGNVDGSACDSCKTGFFGLGDWHTGGCIPCFCWDKGTTCGPAANIYDNPIGTTSASTWPDGWTAANGTGTPTTVMVKIDTESWLKISAISDTDTDLYFLAPSKYLGDRSSSYGRSLSMVTGTEVTAFGQTDGAPPTDSIDIDVIIEGIYSAMALKYSSPVVVGGTQTFTISMSENSWQVVDKTTVMTSDDQATPLPKATFAQMMEVLTSVSSLRIQAYNDKTPTHSLMLRSLTLDAGSEGPSTSTAVNNVEMCQCGDGYSGKHCEICASGYTRSTPNNQDPSTECVVCNCNGHAKQDCDVDTGVCTEVPCDPVSGVCQCADNTQGDHCEMCKVGYYGDPTKGSPDDCLPCACPGIVVDNEVNVFATSCQTNDQGAPVCVDCTLGHMGDNCGICQDGFFGTPENATNADGMCQACVCNGRADTCNPRTGECVDCRNDTAGQECDVCAPGFHGDAMTFSCEECVCKDYPGSTGDCNPSTGQCVCLLNVVGNLCDQCQDAAFNLQAEVGCELCNCHESGSTSEVCDKTNGNCPCRNLVEGRQCDQCQDSFWNINTVTGCDSCDCNAQGTAMNGSEIIPTCDVTSGQCQCGRPGTIGRKCDSCSPVTTYEFDYVQLFYLGSFPQCELCGECFDSWGVTIDGIGQETNDLDDKINTIWQLYNNQQPEEIAASLSVTEDKIEKASQSIGTFQSMAQDLVQLQARFGQANEKEEVLSSRTATLSDKESGLKTQLSALEALTALIQLTETTTATVASLQQEMETLMSNTQASITKGTTSWDSIENLQFVVADPADRERQLRNQADASMQIAKLANQTFQLADILYKNNLKPSSEDNAGDLTTAAQKHADASTKLATVEGTANAVTARIAAVRNTLTSLVGSSEQSLKDTSQLVDDLKDFWASASVVKQKALDTLELAEAFQKETAQTEAMMRDSLSAILENLAALSEAQNDLVSSGQQSARVMAVTLRPVSELEGIMADILSTSVSSTDVQAVDLKAQKALFLAEEAVEDTQRALGLARDVNQEVGIMEEDIQASKTLRTEAQGLKNAADMIDNGISAIVTEAEEYINKTMADISLVTSSSQEALANITEIDTCLTQGQIKVTDATTSADRADQRAQTTSQHQQTLIQLMIDVNAESADQTVSQALNSLTQGSSVLSQVVTDRQEVENLTDLQVLVQDLVAQVQEINTLESEINALTSELDGLVLSLEENLDGGSCNA